MDLDFSGFPRAKVGRPPTVLGRTAQKDHLVIAQTYRRFRERHNNFDDDVSVDLFRGLCAYLFTLVRWGWEIKDDDFDGFICHYPIFAKLPGHMVATETSSYHHWFKIHGIQSQARTDVAVLDSNVLETILQENPYTFALAEASLNAILEAQKSTSTRAVSLPSVPQQGQKISTSSQTQLPPTYWQKTSTSPQTQLPPSHLVGSSIGATQFQHLGPLHPEKQWHSEKALRDFLGLRDRQELLAWLRQDWVLGVYDEYCAIELDGRRFQEQSLLENGRSIPPSAKRSSAKFLINASVLALQSGSTKYTREEVDMSNWTGDDHDIRFIVRLVQIGKYPGRWWENCCHAEHLPRLCSIGYNLLSWLRYVHRLSTAKSQSSRVQRAVAAQWHWQLSQARTSRNLP